MRVAVVWNNDYSGVINRFGRSPPKEYRRVSVASMIVESIVAALQESGHTTEVCEGDKGLLATLERFMPPDPQGRPSGMVFNMAAGIQGEYRCTHVPAMLEMAGVPYTGSSPLGHGLTLDKVITKKLLRECGVPTPNFRVMRRGSESIGDLRFPVVVKPRHEHLSLGLQLVHEPTQLRQAVEATVTRYAQDALVEEYIEGRELCVALLGNEEHEGLPLVEHNFGDRETRFITWEDKRHIVGTEPPKICPAQVGDELETKLRDISVATFRACMCRDYARVDLRVDSSGQPFVLEINADPSLSIRASYFLAATTAGYSFSSLINRIIDVAHRRYFGVGIPKAGHA
ncbi:D-alanine--D-alanine ligase family protein [Bradyrhizobium sp. USDA 4486]